MSHQGEQKKTTDLTDSIGNTAARVADSVLFEKEVMSDDEVTKGKIHEKKIEQWISYKSVKDKAIMYFLLVRRQFNEHESDITGNTQVDVGSVYYFIRIQSFWQNTRGMTLIKVDEFFPDLKLFLDSVRLSSKTHNPLANQPWLKKRFIVSKTWCKKLNLK